MYRYANYNIIRCYLVTGLTSIQKYKKQIKKGYTGLAKEFLHITPVLYYTGTILVPPMAVRINEISSIPTKYKGP